MRAEYGHGAPPMPSIRPDRPPHDPRAVTHYERI